MKETKIFDKITRKLSKNARSFITEKNGLTFLDKRPYKSTTKSLSNTPKILPKNILKYNFSKHIFILPKYKLHNKKILNIPRPNHIKNNLKIQKISRKSRISNTASNYNCGILITSMKNGKKDNNTIGKMNKKSLTTDNLFNKSNDIIKRLSPKIYNIKNAKIIYKKRSVVLRKVNAFQLKEEPKKRIKHKSILIKGNKQFERTLEVKEKFLFDEIKKINNLLKLESTSSNIKFNVKDLMLNDLKKERYNNKKEYYIGNKLSGLFHQKFKNSTIQKYKAHYEEN